MVSLTISLSSEGLKASFHPTPTPTPTDSIYSSRSHSHSHSHSRANSHSISISNRSTSPPPLDTPPPPYYQKYQHPHQQLLYRSQLQRQSQSHRPYSHHRYPSITGPSSITRNQNESIEGLERLLPLPSRISSTPRGRERSNKFVRAPESIGRNRTNHQESSSNSHRERRMIWKRHSVASDGSHPGMDPVEEAAPVERRMSFGRGGAGNIRRPSVVPFAASSTTEANGTSSGARRRSSVWSAINSITPGSSPGGKRDSVVPGAGGGAASGSSSGIMGFFTRRKRDSSTSAAGD